MIRLSDRVRLVRAPNPGPMTLDGTNTYLIGDGEDLLLVDPGPAGDGHLDAVRVAVAGARVACVLLTHHHPDHDAGAAEFADAFDAQVLAFAPPADVLVADDASVGGHSVFVRAIHTPGHASDHLCFFLEEEDALFSGDHVLGRGTTAIVWPNGDMAAYMASLERVRALGANTIHPGHGPVVENPAAVLDEYVAHRLRREAQIVSVLTAGPATPKELVARIYTDVDPKLHRVAELSVRAHLAKLAHEHRAVADGDRWTFRGSG